MNEKVLYPLILVEKAKPKDILGMFKNQQRYLLFTNLKLYTLKKDECDKGILDYNKLVANKIDLKFLSHLIMLPQFSLSKFSDLDNQKVANDKQHIIRSFQNDSVEVIIGFQDETHNKVSDIALTTKTNFYQALQLIYVC